MSLDVESTLDVQPLTATSHASPIAASPDFMEGVAVARLASRDAEPASSVAIAEVSTTVDPKNAHDSVTSVHDDADDHNAGGGENHHDHDASDGAGECENADTSPVLDATSDDTASLTHAGTTAADDSAAT